LATSVRTCWMNWSGLVVAMTSFLVARLGGC